MLLFHFSEQFIELELGEKLMVYIWRIVAFNERFKYSIKIFENIKSTLFGGKRFVHGFIGPGGFI